MLDALTSLFSFFRQPARLLLAAPLDFQVQPLSDDEVPVLWDMLAPNGKQGHLSTAYLPLQQRVAAKRLDYVIGQLQQRGGTVRGAFLCSAQASVGQGFPALSVGLLKLYSELPKTARWTTYAPVQRFQKDEKGWLWLALLLAEPNPNKATVPAITLVKTAPQPEALLARLMEVPVQTTYPAPVQVADLPPLRADSEVITKQLPVDCDDEAAEIDDEADGLEDGSDETSEAVIEELVAPAPVVAAAPVTKPVPAVAPLDDEPLLDWLTLDTQKAPRIALSAVLQADNIAFIGPKGSGKTTGLLTAVKYRKGQVIALDPHATPDKWPCQTVGNGRKYDAIRQAFKALQKKMQERFDEIGDGTRGEKYYQFPQRQRTMVSDEFRSTGKNVPPIKAVRDKGIEIKPAQFGAGDYLLERITEGRKVGECVMIAAQNDTNESLALPTGAAGLKACFDYFVFHGGMALERYEQKGKARPEALTELRAMRYPAVVWHTERNQWYLLDFDLEPVLPPDDEEHDEEQDETLELATAVPARPRVPAAPTPALALRLLAQRAAIPVPVTGSVKERLALLDDSRVVTMLHVVGRRGLNAQDAAQVLFTPVNGDLRTAVKKILDTASHA